MVYPGNFMRLVVSGSLYTDETFSFGLSIVPNFTSEPDPDPADLVEDAATAVQTFWTSSAISSRAILQTVKLNMIGPNGRYVSDGDTVQFDYTPPVPATGAGTMPAQIALAISLMTDATRGRAHAGRFYVPVPTYTPGNNGQITETQAGAFGGTATTMINSLNALTDGAWAVGVASDAGTGAFRTVRRVRVGRVYDTIRSRRRSLDENYVEGAPVTY